MASLVLTKLRAARGSRRRQARRRGARPARPPRRAGQAFGGPTVTNDGVTVAREIDLEDPFSHSAQLVKSVATDVAGAAPPPRP
jgi:hypothetical protein